MRESPHTITTWMDDEYIKIHVGKTGDDWSPSAADANEFYAQIEDGPFHFGTTKKQALLLLLDGLDNNLNRI